MEIQFKGYDNTFSETLRLLMSSHPHTGEKTTQKKLAEAIGTRPQTVSLYMDGTTQPTAENLYKIARHFDVSVDYLLTGVSSDNKELHKQLGLSEEAINSLKKAQVTSSAPHCTDVVTTLNALLSDREFYAFLEDLTYKTETLRTLINQSAEEKSNRPAGINMEGYFAWDLQTFIQDYIKSELKKRGLSLIEE
ncbi:MAG: helix-turn-helix transcriptional regulator [Niameybacter sp.]